MKHLQKFLLILFLGFLATPIFGQQAMYVNAGSLNLRSSPNTQSEIIEKASHGEEVLVVDDLGNGWKKVELANGSVAYAYGKYLSETRPIERVVKANEATVLICNSSSAYAYHSSRCRGLNRCKAGISSVSVSEAKGSGYKACKICY